MKAKNILKIPSKSEDDLINDFYYESAMFVAHILGITDNGKDLIHPNELMTELKKFIKIPAVKFFIRECDKGLCD